MLAKYLAAQGFALKKKTQNEWSMPCPVCGGKDRMIIREVEKPFSTSKYWCRKCGISGDYYSWLIDIEGQHPSVRGKSERSFRQNQTMQKKPVADPDPYDWDVFHAWALKVVCGAEKHSLAEGKAFYQGRGLNDDTVRALQFGWVPDTKDFFFSAEQTGRRDGRVTCIPSGALLPVYGASGEIDSILVRRTDRSRSAMCQRIGVVDDGKACKWHQVGDQRSSFLLGEKGQRLILCESILDAASAWQAMQGFCACAAFLGASKKPDARALEYIHAAPSVLICGDADEGGDTLCEMALELRPDALIWRPRAEGVKDLNDALVQVGDDQLCLFLAMGFAQLVNPEDF